MSLPEPEGSFLVHTDFRGIQRFVFASSQLRDVVGRSAMIAWAADEDDGPLRDAVTATTGATVLSAAGGRAVVACPDEPTARGFATRYSAALLRACRDLDPVMTVTAATGGVWPALAGTLPAQAGRTSGTWIGRAGIAGLSITTPCAVTGLPADTEHTTGKAGRREQVTAAVARIRDLGAAQSTRFTTELLGEAGDPEVALVFPSQIDLLGRTSGVRSTVGVIHLDLDGLGTRMADWMRHHEQGELASIRVVERAVAGFVTGLARHLVAVTCDAVELRGPALTGRPDRLSFPLAYERESDSAPVMLPLRPVLVGGDDLTILCDGRLAWSLTAAAFDYLDTPPNPPTALVEAGLDPAPLTACAGVAVISSGYPLSAAQAVAGQLCAQAKTQAAAKARSKKVPRVSHVAWYRGDHDTAALAGASPRVYTADDFRFLLEQFLDPAVPTSLRGEQPTGPPAEGDAASEPTARPWSQRRTWLRNDFLRLLRSHPTKPRRATIDLLTQTEHLHGRPELPPQHPVQALQGRWWGEAALDAVDLLDRHLEIRPRPASAEKDGDGR